MAVPAFVDYARDAASGNGTSVAFNWTTSFVGEADGDIAIMCIYKENTDAVTTPSGWTAVTGSPFVQDSGGFKYRLETYWKVKEAADTGAATFSWTNSTWCSFYVSLWRGVAATPLPTVGFDKETAQNDTTSNPGITVAGSESVLLFLVGNFAGTSVTTGPTGFTSDGSIVREIFAFYDNTVSPGATGAITTDLVDDEWSSSVLLEISASVLLREQEGFLWRNDDGSEAAATPKAAQDQAIVLPQATNARLRPLLNYTGAPPGEAPKLQWRRSGQPNSEYRDVKP